MSIRKYWLLALVIVSSFSIIFSSILLMNFVDRDFNLYLTEDYEKHISEVVGYLNEAMRRSDVSFIQMALEMETHLDDPIIRLRLYNASGLLVVDVDSYQKNSMMRHGMMNQPEEESDQYTIGSKKEVLGFLSVTRLGNTENSVVAKLFNSKLILNTVVSIFITAIVIVFFGNFISKRMSKELTETAKYASELESGVDRIKIHSKITEVNQIHESLSQLNTRLNLKQKARKASIDELVHQSRTPITIIKSQIEAYEDGIIHLNGEEISILYTELNNLEQLISNVSNMIETDFTESEMFIENFEINALIQQIINGLKSQFTKNRISIKHEFDHLIPVYTERYKISQAIYNLLSNAAKYVDSGGSVVVTCFELYDDVVIKIIDDGPGIREDEVPYLFDAYYRGESGLKRKGDGLGLFIAKENLSKVSGTIQFLPSDRIGTTFEVRFPKSLKR